MTAISAGVLILLTTVGSIQTVRNTTYYHGPMDARTYQNSDGFAPASNSTDSPSPYSLLTTETSHDSSTTAFTYRKIFTLSSPANTSFSHNKWSTGFSDWLKMFLFVGASVTLLPFFLALFLHHRKKRNTGPSAWSKHRARKSRHGQTDNDYELPFDQQHVDMDVTVTSNSKSEDPHSQSDLVCKGQMSKNSQEDSQYEESESNRILSDSVYQTLDPRSRSDSIYHTLNTKSSKSESLQTSVHICMPSITTPAVS